MRKLFSFIILTFSMHTAIGQMGITSQISLFKPTGEVAYIYKPGGIAEIGFSNSILRKRGIAYGNLGFGFANPIYDKVPSVEYFQEYGITRVEFNEIRYLPLKIYTVSIGANYLLFPPPKKSRSKKSALLSGFNATVGLEVNMIFVNISDEVYKNGMQVSSNINQELKYVGLTPKLGGACNIGKSTTLFMGLAKTGSRSPDGVFNFWKPYLQLNYEF